MLKYNIVVDTFLGTLKIQISDKINNQFIILDTYYAIETQKFYTH